MIADRNAENKKFLLSAISYHFFYLASNFFSMYTSSKQDKPGFSEKIKRELKKEDKPDGKSPLLLILLILLGIALLFFLIALIRGCGGEKVKEVKTEEPAAQEEQETTEGTEATTSGLEEGSATEEAASAEGQTYEVQSGDTLSSVGEKLNVSWQKIAEVNNLSAPYDLTVGDKLTIPAASSE
ncbi:LysM peptidoglycan-binding domain-containing protein [Patescibacteria group bacterium]